MNRDWKAEPDRRSVGVVERWSNGMHGNSVRKFMKRSPPILHHSITPHSLRFAAAFLLLILFPLLLFAADFDAGTATLDDLIFHAQRYGNTPEKQRRREQATAELMARGTNSLRGMMGMVHLDNVMLQVLTQQVAESLKPEAAEPVLMEYLDSPRDRTRKIAAFFLSLYDHPTDSNYAGRLVLMLEDDESAGAALRALGKWRVKKATDRIIPFLQHEKELRRVAAANALRDIGDPAAIPALVKALSDPYFTVREASARALSTLGEPAESALLALLPGASEPALRHSIRTLGVMKSGKAVPVLQKMIQDSDPWVRFDAERALALITAAQGLKQGVQGRKAVLPRGIRIPA
ncbi:MAG: HEAT repeat domain-containing protein, partial [Lentisphaerota bacterium]